MPATAAVVPIKPAAGPLPMPQVEVISPTKAAQYLRTMIGNRPLSQSKTIEYALAMEAGKWSLNGETIKFDEQGHLFDGQHRLQAAILAAVPFRTYVIRGITDANAFATVDTGKIRSHADMFGIDGWQNNGVASAAAQLIYMLENDRVTFGGIASRVRRGQSKVLDKIKRMPTASLQADRNTLIAFGRQIRNDLQIAVRFSNNSRASRILSKATITALYYLFRAKNPSDADRFFMDLGEGVGLTKNDPVYVLREKLIASKTSKTKLTRWAILGYTIKAWNRRRAGKPMTMIKVLEGEKFPKVT